MKPLSFLPILCLFLVFSCGKPEISDTMIIGVKVYDHEGDLEDLFARWQGAGINTLFVSPQLARKPGFMELAEKYSMPVYLIVPTFYNPEALKADSSLYAITAEGQKAMDDWVEFICPNRRQYREDHLEYLKSLVREILPDGISIDFIRYFVYWEQVFPEETLHDLPQTCFDDTCLAVFSDRYKIRFPEDADTRAKKANYILTNHQDDWTRFKIHTITSWVNEITGSLRKTDPALRFNLHLVPWRETDFEGAIRKIAGQDAGDLGSLVDFISPMCYSHMVKRPPDWIHEVVADLDTESAGQILPSIQVTAAYREEPFSEESFRMALQGALDSPSKGVIFWSWEALEKDPGKLKVVKSELNGK
jgi:hypothetical protein